MEIKEYRIEENRTRFHRIYFSLRVGIERVFYRNSRYLHRILELYDEHFYSHVGFIHDYIVLRLSQKIQGYNRKIMYNNLLLLVVLFLMIDLQSIPKIQDFMNLIMEEGMQYDLGNSIFRPRYELIFSKLSCNHLLDSFLKLEYPSFSILYQKRMENQLYSIDYTSDHQEMEDDKENTSPSTGNVTNLIVDTSPKETIPTGMPSNLISPIHSMNTSTAQNSPNYAIPMGNQTLVGQLNMQNFLSHLVVQNQILTQKNETMMKSITELQQQNESLSKSNQMLSQYNENYLKSNQEYILHHEILLKVNQTLTQENDQMRFHNEYYQRENQKLLHEIYELRKYKEEHQNFFRIDF